MQNKIKVYYYDQLWWASFPLCFNFPGALGFPEWAYAMNAVKEAIRDYRAEIMESRTLRRSPLPS
jgi:hypothetical protein